MNARADRGLIETPEQQRAREDAQRDEARKERDIDDQIGFEQREETDERRRKEGLSDEARRREERIGDEGRRRGYNLSDRDERREWDKVQREEAETEEAIRLLNEALPGENADLEKKWRGVKKLQADIKKGKTIDYSEGELAAQEEDIRGRLMKLADAEAQREEKQATAEGEAEQRDMQIDYIQKGIDDVGKEITRLDKKEDALRKEIDTIDSSISTNETRAAGLDRDQDKEKRAKIEADTEALKKRKLDLEKQLDGFESEREKLLTERKTYRDQWGGMIGIQQPGQQPAGEAPAGEAPAGEAPIVTPEEIKHAIGVVGL